MTRKRADGARRLPSVRFMLLARCCVHARRLACAYPSDTGRCTEPFASAAAARRCAREKCEDPSRARVVTGSLESTGQKRIGVAGGRPFVIRNSDLAPLSMSTSRNMHHLAATLFGAGTGMPSAEVPGVAVTTVPRHQMRPLVEVSPAVGSDSQYPADPRERSAARVLRQATRRSSGSEGIAFSDRGRAGR